MRTRSSCGGVRPPAVRIAISATRSRAVAGANAESSVDRLPRGCRTRRCRSRRRACGAGDGSSSMTTGVGRCGAPRRAQDAAQQPAEHAAEHGGDAAARRRSRRRCTTTSAALHDENRNAPVGGGARRRWRCRRPAATTRRRRSRCGRRVDPVGDQRVRDGLGALQAERDRLGFGARPGSRCGR